MEHRPLPNNYYTEDLWTESPLTEEERDAFRDELRHLILSIREETDLRDIAHSPIANIDLARFRDEASLSVSVYLDTSDLETAPRTNEMFDEDGEATVTNEVHYLRDLGDEWAALEYDILSELVLMLDLPASPEELQRYLLDGENHGPCLYGTTSSPGRACFDVVAHIPDHTQEIYDNAEFEIARRLNIPIED